MAIGLQSDFKVYQEEFQGGYWEGLSQFIDVWNGASANALRLVTEDLLGNYAYEAFYKSISSVVTRRDTTSVSAATDLAMTQDENISVKLDRKFGPVAQTLDALRKIGADEREMSFILGQMFAEEAQEDMVNTAILAIEAALDGQATLSYDGTGDSTTTLTLDKLVSGQAKRGDKGQEIVAWVGHSKAFYDLVKNSITNQAIAFQLGPFTVMSGTPATLGRPFIVVDAGSLTDANGSLTDTYNTLGLVANAVVVTQSEAPILWSDQVTGLENLVYRFQGEYSYNIMCKGFKWDVTNGGANPTDATLGTVTNWDLAVSDVKQAAGVWVRSE